LRPGVAESGRVAHRVLCLGLVRLQDALTVHQRADTAEWLRLGAFLAERRGVVREQKGRGAESMADSVASMAGRQLAVEHRASRNATERRVVALYSKDPWASKSGSSRRHPWALPQEDAVPLVSWRLSPDASERRLDARQQEQRARLQVGPQQVQPSRPEVQVSLRLWAKLRVQLLQRA
jgi:hypothetical protein